MQRFFVFFVMMWCAAGALAQHGAITTNRVYPYARIGLALTLPNDKAGIDTHTGLMLGGGVRIPLDRREHIHLQTELQYVSKGMMYKNKAISNDILADANYLMLPVSISYNFYPETSFGYSIGAGLYGAYGVGGHIDATEGMYYYEGFPVDGHRSTFTDGGFPRWDVGGQLVNVLRYKHVLLSFDLSFSFLKRKMIGGNQNICNIATLSLGIGYEL